MTAQDCFKSNSLIEDKHFGKMTQAQKQKDAKSKTTTRKKTSMSPHIQTIKRTQQAGPAPAADMGQNANSTAYYDSIPTVISDLCG